MSSNNNSSPKSTIKSPRARRSADLEEDVSPRKRKAAHKAAAVAAAAAAAAPAIAILKNSDEKSPRAMSPRVRSPRIQSPRLVAAVTTNHNEDDADEVHSEEVHKHGAFANQFALLLHMNSSSHHEDGAAASQIGGGGGGFGASPSRLAASNGVVYDTEPQEGDGVEYVDEYQFTIKPHAIEAYKKYRIATAGAAEMKMQRYAAVLSPSLTKHKDADATELVLLGVPMQARRKWWLTTSRASVLIITRRRYYRTLCARLKRIAKSMAKSNEAAPADEIDPAAMSQIDMDVGRTLGSHQLSDSSAYLKRLRRVLHLYCLHNKDEGFTQGLNFFAASLLVQGMSDEECFWMLHVLANDFFPMSFDVNCTGQMADLDALDYYCEKMFPDLNKLLIKHSLDFRTLCTLELLGSLMCGVMPYESVFVVWDRMMYGGPAAFFDAVFKIIGAMEKEITALVDKDTASIKKRACDFISGIVDMPKLLARKLKSDYTVDWRALNLRRMKLREFYYRNPARNSRKITAHGSASSSSSMSTSSSSSSSSFEVAKPTSSTKSVATSASTSTTSPSSKSRPTAEKKKEEEKPHKHHSHHSSNKKEKKRDSLPLEEEDASVSKSVEDKDVIQKLNLSQVKQLDTSDLPQSPSMHRQPSFRRQRGNSTLRGQTVAASVDSNSKADTVSMTTHSDDDTVDDEKEKKSKQPAAAAAQAKRRPQRSTSE